MLRRSISKLRSWLGSSSEPDRAPEPDVDAVIDDVRLRDQQLRNEAARVIGQKIVLISRVEELAVTVGESRALARESLARSDEALSAGDEGVAAKWSDLARSHAVSLRASEDELTSLRSRYRERWVRAAEAKSAIHDNAAALEELSRGQTVGSGIIETLTAALSTSIVDETPSPEALDSVVDRLVTEGSARADFRRLEPGRHERREAVNMTEADARLDALRAESDR
ncbi:MAG: hypothetical protein ACLFWH_14510 [Actinomycetota bacterium]